MAPRTPSHTTLRIHFNKLNSKTFRTENIAEELVLSITKTTDILIKQTKTKPQEELHFERKTAKQTFSFDTPLKVEHNGNCLSSLSTKDVKNSGFLKKKIEIKIRNNF